MPANGYYPLRDSGEVWLNHWLGCMVDISGQPNDLNRITVSFFSSDALSKPDQGSYQVDVMIDNTCPTARIEEIVHDGQLVDTCAIVQTGSHTFQFNVTASAPRHLMGWELDSCWGDNQSKLVGSNDYKTYSSHPHLTGRIWTGLNHASVPSGTATWDALVPGDKTSIQCAHTFILEAWDRVINGWNYVHGTAEHRKSITLMFKRELIAPGKN